jgi:hypothetical protein
VLFAVVMAVPAWGCWRFRLNTVIAFWWTHIVTRPLGASVADWLSKPTKPGGLAYGDGPVAAILLAFAPYARHLCGYQAAPRGRRVSRRERPLIGTTHGRADVPGSFYIRTVTVPLS